MRNQHIAELEAEVACNDILLGRLHALQPELAQSGKARFSSEVERLRTNPSPDAPKTNAAKPIAYDEMVLHLLETIANEARERAGSDEGKLEKLLEERLDFHVKKLGEVTEERRKEKDDLLQEKAKHITMDDLHDGFDSKVTSVVDFVNAIPAQVMSSMFPQSPNQAQSPAKERPRRLTLRCSTQKHPHLHLRHHHRHPSHLPVMVTMKSRELRLLWKHLPNSPSGTLKSPGYSSKIIATLLFLAHQMPCSWLRSELKGRGNQNMPSSVCTRA